MSQLITLDQNLLKKLTEITNGNSTMNFVIASVAQYLVYSVPIILLVMWFWPSYDNLKKLRERKTLLSTLLTALVSWFAITQPLTHIFHRARPDLALLGHNELFFHRPTFSFPSDHASMLYGITFYLYFAGEHKKAHLFLIIAILVSIARVFSGVHFPFDILAGALVGLVGASIVRLCDRYFEGIWEKLIKLLVKIKLA